MNFFRHSSALAILVWTALFYTTGCNKKTAPVFPFVSLYPSLKCTQRFVATNTTVASVGIKILTTVNAPKDTQSEGVIGLSICRTEGEEMAHSMRSVHVGFSGWLIFAITNSLHLVAGEEYVLQVKDKDGWFGWEYAEEQKGVICGGSFGQTKHWPMNFYFLIN